MGTLNLRLDFLAVIAGITMLYVASCDKSPSTAGEQYSSSPEKFALEPQSFTEVSGITDSRMNLGYFWMQEDSGNPADIHLTKHDGKVYRSVHITGASNRDWEDIAIGKGPDPALDYIFVGDIGDNGQVHNEYIIYRFPEPSLTVDTVETVSRIRFKYPDGSHDAEALLVDDLNKEIFIITKRDSSSRVYKLNTGYSDQFVNTASFVTTLPYNGVVSASISSDRKDILIKTYLAVNHYPVSGNESIASALSKSPSALPYQVEPQGEAICFANDQSGYFTLSEKAFSPSVNLYFYRKR